MAVVAGPREQYATQHPQTAVLIVEVSESSLDYDRSRKASLYAAAGKDIVNARLAIVTAARGLPKYAEVAATIRAQIADGTLLPGQPAIHVRHGD